MSKPRATIYRVGHVSLTAEPGWQDVTSQVQGASAPFTLAKQDGFGVFQLSSAEYLSGKPPELKLADLQTLLRDFASARNLQNGFGLVTHQGDVLRVAMSFVNGRNFIRVWLCSNGCDVATLTYVCARVFDHHELAACEIMASSIQFA